MIRLNIIVLLALTFIGCQAQSTTKTLDNKSTKMDTITNNPANLDTATLGAGCFWCVEAVFQQMKGVVSVLPGYSGGFKENPTYKEVCNETTGHAEVAQIVYDTTQTSFTEILEVFFGTHDPTTLNRQGNDVGTQYRSAIFYHNPAQKAEAERVIKELTAEAAYPNPIITEVSAFTKFYVAEDYHINYYNKTGDSNSYCTFVVKPKVEKFKKVFKDKLKTQE